MLINCYYFLILCVVVGIVLCCIVILCIDILDGLFFDFNYILIVFGCGVNIYVDRFFLLCVIISVVDNDMVIEYVLSVGDDYEFIFIVSEE